MQCPIDGETLLMTARNGVEIDYCPKCRGVWLDRGELDKIIERSDSGVSKDPIGSQNFLRKENDVDDDDDDDDDDRKKSRKSDKKREKSSDDRRKDFYKKSSKHASFIKELFDF